MTNDLAQRGRNLILPVYSLESIIESIYRKIHPWLSNVILTTYSGKIALLRKSEAKNEMIPSQLDFNGKKLQNVEVVSEWPLLSWTELLHHFALTKTPPVAPHSVRRPHRALRNHTWAVLSTWSAGTFCHRSRELPQIRENPTAELETTSHSTQHTRGYLNAQDAIYMWSWHFTFALILQLS